MLPFHVYCDQPEALLVELSDGRFQAVTHESLSPFMVGYNYVLVEAPLAEFLHRLGLERVQFEPAVIWDPASKSEITTHVRLRIGQFFTTSQINDLALEGPRLLALGDQYCFVSPALKELLQQSPFSYLRFSEGLSEFAAHAT